MVLACALILAGPALQMQRSQASYRVESVPESGSAVEVGSGSWSSGTGIRGDRNVIWEFRSHDKSGWRHEWTYAADGSLQYEAYETVFGQTKSRWYLEPRKEGWEFRRGSSVTNLARSLRLNDGSIHWFSTNPPKAGAETTASVFDPGTLRPKRGVVKLLRTEPFAWGSGALQVHVVEKRYDDVLEVFYLDDKGVPMRIDRVYPGGPNRLIFTAVRT